MYKLYITLFCALLISPISNINAQNLPNLIGEWKGKLKDSLGEFDYQLRIENEKSSAIIGTSISSSEGFSCETKVGGIKKGNKITVFELQIVKTNYEKKQNLCLLKLELTISNNKLIGTYTPINNTPSCLSGNIILNKIESKIKKTTQIKEIIKNKVEEKSSNTPIENIKTESLKSRIDPIINLKDSEISKPSNIEKYTSTRATKLIKEIYLDDSEAEITIFDNGAIDGDIITLIDNDRIIFEKIMLSNTPIKYKLTNTYSQIHDIKFFAENLGDIPPNTGLLIIKTKNKRIECNFSSDFVQTSLIRFVMKTD
jgi:hypothetical protein